MKNLSYWEQQTWLSDIDFAIIGSGIVGLNCALSIKKRQPTAKVVVFEKGMLPSGASTKNAGFACFGSLSEILEDLKTHSEAEVIALVNERISGLKRLRKLLTDEAIGYQQLGGYELFDANNTALYDTCVSQLDAINTLLFPIFNTRVFSVVKNTFGFKKISENIIFNAFEGQINTGKMMEALIRKATLEGIHILNNATVTHIESFEQHATLTVHEHIINSKNICIATNGFASQFLEEDVSPARAQVIITKPIQELQIKGTFHLDCGYYYFRNIDNRILFGGGRNLDFVGENTTETGITPQIQNKLEALLKETILPNTPFEIESRWSGIMGVGGKKKPIIKNVSPNIYCGVRLGGMGVAIGSTIGKQLASIALHDEKNSHTFE